jgi:hypothetical protein
MLAKREESIYSHWQSSNFEFTHRQLAANSRPSQLPKAVILAYGKNH